MSRRFLLLWLLAVGSRAHAGQEGAALLPEGSTLILGFTGGMDRADDPERGVRRVALAIRAMGRPGVYAETFEHYRHREAGRRVVAALDANGNRRVDGEERGRVKIMLYGQSLGGGEVVRLARELGKAGVAVELTVQVDSVSLGRDGHIPPNVRRAANFYQKELLTFRGEDYIQAEDAQRTKILGNFRFRYPLLGVRPLPELSWRRLLGGGHARMEADPLLWAQIQALLVESIR
jgi:hypothetical protein